MTGTISAGWDARKQRTRRALVDHARRLFLERGFAETAAAEIAAAAGVSERTFFRYFDTKEAAALGDVSERGDDLVALLGSRPTHEPFATSVREAMRGFVGDARDRADRAREVELVRTCPELLTYLFERMLRWEAELVEIIEARIAGHDRLRARILAASITTLIRVGVMHETESGAGAALFDISEDALAIMEPLWEGVG